MQLRIEAGFNLCYTGVVNKINLQRIIPAAYVNSRIVFANTKTSGARTSQLYCMPINWDTKRK